MGLGENWLNHLSLVLLEWCGFSLNSTHTFSLDYYTTRSCFGSLKFPPRLSTCKECHIFQHTGSAPLTTIGFLRGNHCLTPLRHLLPVSAFHISLSSQISQWGFLKVLIAQDSARSRDERMMVEFIDPITDKHTHQTVSVIPQPFSHPLERSHRVDL